MADSPDGAERRRYKRRAVHFPVRYRLGAEGVITEWKEGDAGNVSAGGLLMTFGEKIEAGRVLDLEFSIPGADAPIHTRGRVAWVRDRVPGVMVECGLEFDELPPIHKKSLLEYAEGGDEAR
jgi:c-di-GMP-binding flagellar brake protein YcgR